MDALIVRSMERDIGLVDHLEELRRRLIVVGISVLGLGVFSFLISDFWFRLATAPILDIINSLYFFSPFEAFLTKLKISAVSGIILSSPVIFTQLWQFISPGLYQSEKKLILILTSSCTVLFLIGVLFAYFLVIPTALRFFLDFRSSSLTPLISLGSYLSFFFSFLITFGAMFDVPAVLLGMIWLRVLETQFLICQRKTVIVLIFILAAIFTPTSDPLTQCLLAIPLWILFEVSILAGKIIEKRQNQPS